MGVFGIVSKHRVEMTTVANALAQGFAVRAGNGRLPGRIDIDQQQRVDFREHLDEVVVKISGARVTMGLIGHD